MKDGPKDEGRDADDRPFSEMLQDMILREEQPLLGIGWRIDLERQGLTRPDQFIPRGAVEAMRDALRGGEVRGADATAYRDPVTGMGVFTLEDLEAAAAAFEDHEAEQERRAGERDGEAWARDALTPPAAVGDLAGAYWEWHRQPHGSGIRLDAAFGRLPGAAQGMSWAYRRGFAEAVARLHARASEPAAEAEAPASDDSREEGGEG